MPKNTKVPRKPGPKGLGNAQGAKTAFDPAKLKNAKGPLQGKGLVHSTKRLQVPGKGRAR